MTIRLDAAVHVRSYPGAPRGGDFGVIRPLDDGALLALVDATGHGLTAYAAARVARETLLQTPSDRPEAVLGELHEALRGTVGAAASVVRLFPDRFTFAGIGNVAVWAGARRLAARDGTLGQRIRPARQVEQDLPSGEWLIFATDGVAYAAEDVLSGDAEALAQRLVERHGKLHDDAGVLAARWVEVPE